MVKSHIRAANAPFRIEIPGKKSNIVANESIPCPKHRRPVGAKEKNLENKKLQQINYDTPKDSLSIKKAINIVSKSSPNIDPPEKEFVEEIQLPENNEI